MTQPRSGSEYGVPFLYNAIPLGDPRAAETFAQHNRLGDDVAQLTRISARAWVIFQPALANVAIAPVAGRSQMGVATTNLPTIARTGTGLYTVTYPASWTDGAGTDPTGVGQLEPITLSWADGRILDLKTFGRVQCTVNNAGSPAINAVIVQNVSGTDTASDLSVNVSGAASGTAGVIRLTVTSTAQMTTGNTSVVAGVVGTGGLTAAANGTFQITVVDGTHVELNGTTFVGAYSSGGAITSGAYVLLLCV